MAKHDSRDETEDFSEPDIESQRNGSEVYTNDEDEENNNSENGSSGSKKKSAEDNVLGDDRSEWEYVDHPDPDSPDEKELGNANNKFEHAVQFFTRGHAIPWKTLGIVIAWTALMTTLSWIAGRRWSKNTDCRWWVSVFAHLL